MSWIGTITNRLELGHDLDPDPIPSFSSSPVHVSKFDIEK